ncbi:hypothetical protein [Enterocloster clostridioformis]|jgi:hypothetical protein|uniref:hypothetical protein n=2 Tax=Enterocloster clostridioformis TaxID=1531 RepID=UPI00070F98BD|nr:hypothetical protein [Enterocloster clostridioformis]MCA5580846.1 hypothetical protein [Enterocloster clostridioformis]
MKSIMGNHGTFFDPYQGGKGKATKPVLICGGIAAGLALVVLAIAYAKRVCRYATIFMDYY